MQLNFHTHGNTQVIDIVLNSGNETEAIRRADKLNQEHLKNKKNPIDSNPNTLVYRLVEKLRELLAFYFYLL